MYDEQHDDAKPLRVVGPSPEMPVLYTPDQFHVGSRSLRIPTPPATERPFVDSHLDRLRKRRVSGQVVDSDVELRCERQGPMTAPVVSDRRRVVANFKGVEHRATGSAVIDMAISQGAGSASTVSVIICWRILQFIGGSRSLVNNVFNLFVS